MRIICCLFLLLGLTRLDAAAEGIELGGEDERDDFVVLEPAWVDQGIAQGMAEGSGSLILYVFTTGILARDAFWTTAGVEASQRLPIVAVSGGLQAPQAAAWGVVELPALVRVDHHGNVWGRLQGKAVKPAVVEEMVLGAEGLLTRIQTQIADDIAQAVEQAKGERKLPAVIKTLTQYAALSGLPEAATARKELDRIVARGLAELQNLAAQMQSDPAAARRQLPRFERLYADTPLLAQAQRVRAGLPIDMSVPAAVDNDVEPAADAPVDFLGQD